MGFGAQKWVRQTSYYKVTKHQSPILKSRQKTGKSHFPGWIELEEEEEVSTVVYNTVYKQTPRKRYTLSYYHHDTHDI
jgi:hypothetical protein